jgi:uroporphyrinogen decarboxylase
MRQAGRYQPEYREIRKKYSLFEICEHPEVCAEVTMLPVKQLDADAAILFSDIFTPVRAIGFPVELNPGPIIHEPIRSLADVAKIRLLEPEADIPYVLETIKLLVRDLTVPLIGFAGAPFTLASYLIEGGATKDYAKLKAMMYGEPAIWAALMDRLTLLTIDYLKAQIGAGAHIVQLFDSWCGNLTAIDYNRYVRPYSARIAAAIHETGTPFIHFGFGSGHLLQTMSSIGVDVQGVDWKEPIDEAWDRIGPEVGVQGNLDPVVLFAPPAVVEEKVKDILQRVGTRKGFIFNLGHGVLPATSMATLQRVSALVHSFDPKEGTFRG